MKYLIDNTENNLTIVVECINKEAFEQLGEEEKENIIERVTLAQPVERLSGSAITIRTFTVF